MKSAMSVRCPQCAYENRNLYRFCGMCGAVLPEAPETGSARAAEKSKHAESKSSTRTAVATSAAENTSPRNVDYLLEEQPKHGHGRMYAALVMLLLAAVVVVWRFEHEGLPWVDKIADAAPHASSSTVPAKPVESPAPNPPESHAAVSIPQPAAPLNEQKSSAITESPTPASAEATPAPQNPEPKAPEDTDGTTPAKTNPAAAKPQPVKPTPVTVATASKPAKPEAKPPAAVTSYDDKLATDGENYLYGTGMPQNCDLAQKNLKQAANRSNARALTVLGTMYATGHCVTRDVPTAYRWFAKALHQDPTNARIERDLEVLWKQMTPDERQVATRSQ